MKRTTGLAIAMAAALSGIAPGARAANQLNVGVGFAGNKAAKELPKKVDNHVTQGLHARAGELTVHRFSDDGNPAPPDKVLDVTITITGRDDPKDEGDDADEYDVRLTLSDGGAPFEIEIKDVAKDEDGTELLKHLDHELAALLKELDKRHE